MRKSKEWSAPLGKKPAVFAVDVAEVPNLPTAPSSSSTSPNSKGDATLDQGTSAVQKSLSLSVPSSHAYRSDSNPPTHIGNGVVSESGSNGPAATEAEAPSKQSEEGSPHSAWYRIIYKVRLHAGLHCLWLLCQIMKN